MTTVIKPTVTPRYSSAGEYMRYFTELAAEYTARAERLEARLSAGGTLKGSPDGHMIARPSTEFEDVMCFTRVRGDELRRILPPLFDAYRRIRRAQQVALRAQRIARKHRMGIAEVGIDYMLTGELHDPRSAANTENEIDQWLDSMTGACTWSEKDHLGHKCRKPLYWSHADLGGGRSTERWDEALRRWVARSNTEVAPSTTAPPDFKETTMNTTANTTTALRHWANGNTCLSAAVDMLAGFNGGHLLDGPWIRHDGYGSVWFDPSAAQAECGYLSGGERRVLAVATSLASSEHPADLGDIMSGISPAAFSLVIQALGQAYGLELHTDNQKDN